MIIRCSVRVVLLALLVVLSGCDRTPDGVRTTHTDSSPGDGTNITDFLATDGGMDGFARALGPRAFQFPQDHGSHPDFRTEWWYFTGNLTTDEDRHFGFQLTFFRIALAAAGPRRESAFGTRQVWMAHFTLTDTTGEQFYFHEAFERDALGLAGVTVEPFRVWLHDWTAASVTNAFFPLKLTASGDTVAIRLTLGDGKPLLLQGDAGLDRKGPEPGEASYYYSFTRMPVRGEILVGDEAYEVAGLAWMDREWSTSVLGPDLEGWDWFSLQLDDGSDVMFYRLRKYDKSMSPFSGGVLVSADGNRITRFGAGDTELVATDAWTSPASGVRYNLGWNFSVPKIGLRLRIRPRIDDQELLLSVRYWEGAITAEGLRDDSAVTAVGYAEYAGVGKER